MSAPMQVPGMGGQQDTANYTVGPSQPGTAAGGYPSADTAYYLANYRLGKTLGIGSFGKVKVAEHTLTGHKVAIKILNRRKIQQMEMEEKVRREIKILRLFMHPHIIRLYEVIETPADIYVVMEYVKTGELFDYIVEKGRLLEDEARAFFQQIISGVEYCHRHMVVHRDLKPENLLLDAKMNVKIADFGLSNIMRDGHFLKTSCGSPNYAAPEVISGKLYAGPEVDVWSCGVILYALLCGSLPFDDENIPNLFKKIKGGIYNLPSHLSPGARDLIPRMLLVDPLKRITIPEIRQHYWFNLHLPRYLAVMQADTVLGAPRIDEEMVLETARLGFDRQQLLESLKARAQNKGTVTYYLMCDNRRKTASSGYLSAEMGEGSTLLAMQQAGVQVAAHGPHPVGHQALPGHGHQAAALQAQGLSAQRLVAERKWRLGVHARGHPQQLMAELYRVLQLNSISWKRMGPYSVKCRRVAQLPRLARRGGSSSGGGGGGGAGGAAAVSIDEDVAERLDLSEDKPMTDRTSSGGGMGGVQGQDGIPPGCAAVKFEVQMYKARDDEYVLDIQRVDGELFLFMDTCGGILADLRI